MSESAAQPIVSKKTRTRSKGKSPEESKKEEKQTPPSNLKKLKREPIKQNKFKERKYFRVSEDWEVLKYWGSNLGDLSVREISDNLSEKIDHSSESIRDRIKRYISKLKSYDKTLLEQEAEVCFNLSFCITL